MAAGEELTVFLCGDVMTGRGLDQILAHSCDPFLREPILGSALEYVRLAEKANGPIPRKVDDGYVWGAAAEVLEREQPDVRVINLETAVTTSDDLDPKGINYRMHPGNVPVLRAAAIDCCVLANNHVLDWGEAGLMDTLDALAAAGIRVAGAGRDLDSARAPALLEANGARVLVFAFGVSDSGIPPDWAATPRQPGVHLLDDLSGKTLDRIAQLVLAVKRSGDVALASVHWGENWGLAVPAGHRRFAQGLIDRAGIDIVHGHSSHHPKAIEIYRQRPIFYGCGDFLNDYEGIRGYEEFRADLVLMYLATIARPRGDLARLKLVPLRIRNFRLQYPASADQAWLRDRLDREYHRFGGHIEAGADGWVLDWRRAASVE